MTIVIFAGGIGTRLWPLSRSRSPKQFEQLHRDQSMLQLAVERVRSFGLDHLYIATTASYAALVQAQVPDLPPDHILLEPVRRDVAAAVGLTLMRLKERGVRGPIAILWSDHFMTKPANFVSALAAAERLVTKEPNRVVFVGEAPRFANHNLGWIHTGKPLDEDHYEFLDWKYRPGLAECLTMFESGEWLWNTGYFVFDLDAMLALYQTHQPEMHHLFSLMGDDAEKIAAYYPNVPALSFDNAIIEKLDPGQAVVRKVDLGWSDPGTLYALKEAMVPTAGGNLERGNTAVRDTRDSLIYNEEPEKLVTAIGLDGMIVVNTKDAILVCHKDRVPEVKALLKQLEAKGLEKYL